MLRVSKIDSAWRKTVFPRLGATKEVTQGVIEISYVDIWHWGSLRAAVRPTVTLRDGVSRSARSVAGRSASGSESDLSRSVVSCNGCVVRLWWSQGFQMWGMAFLAILSRLALFAGGGASATFGCIDAL